MKLYLIAMSVLLQGCAIGALLESKIETQPIFKAPASYQEQAVTNSDAVYAQDAVKRNIQPVDNNQVQRVYSEPASSTQPIQETVQYPVVQAKAAQQNISSSQTTYKKGTYLQVGMFSTVTGAKQVQANTQAATDFPVTINDEKDGEYRVLVGPVSASNLQKVQSELSESGFSYFRYTQ